MNDEIILHLVVMAILIALAAVFFKIFLNPNYPNENNVNHTIRGGRDCVSRHVAFIQKAKKRKQKGSFS